MAGEEAVNLQPRGIPLCPRCRQPVKRFIVREVNGREYVYAVHEKRRQCYLGAAGKYRYVEDLLRLDLTGLTFADYIEIMRRAFDKALETAFRNPSQLKQLEAEIGRMLSELRPERIVNLQTLEVKRVSKRLSEEDIVNLQSLAGARA